MFSHRLKILLNKPTSHHIAASNAYKGTIQYNQPFCIKDSTCILKELHKPLETLVKAAHNQSLGLISSLASKSVESLLHKVSPDQLRDPNYISHNKMQSLASRLLGPPVGTCDWSGLLIRWCPANRASCGACRCERPPGPRSGCIPRRSTTWTCTRTWWRVWRAWCRSPAHSTWPRSRRCLWRTCCTLGLLCPRSL